MLIKDELAADVYECLRIMGTWIAESPPSINPAAMPYLDEEFISSTVKSFQHVLAKRKHNANRLRKR